MSDLVGIDIGSYALKAVGCHRSGKNLKVVGLGSIYNPVGQVLPADDAQFDQLANSISQLAAESKLSGKPIAAAIPESLAYTSIITMPYLSDAELASSIHWEAEQHIPVPLDEVHLEYQVLYKPKRGAVGEKMQVLLVASKKSVVENFTNLFQEAGLELVHLETSLLASYRALASMLPVDQGVVVLNMGALSTDVLVVDAGKMVLSYAISSGGLMLTRAIQQGLNLSGQQAEEYKRAYGFDASQLEGRVRQVMDPVVTILVGEIRKAIQYYQTSQNGSGIRTVVLTGGGGYLKDFAPYLAEILSAEVIVLNPFQGVEVDPSVSIPKDVAAYSVALGLASAGAV